jgi:hypothetical protein
LPVESLHIIILRLGGGKGEVFVGFSEGFSVLFTGSVGAFSKAVFARFEPWMRNTLKIVAFTNAQPQFMDVMTMSLTANQPKQAPATESIMISR